MNSLDNFSSEIAKISGIQDTDSGKLGYTAYGDWHVVDPDDPKKFLVRFPNGNHVSAFHQNKVPQKYDLNVLVGKDHLGRPIILGEDRPSNQNFHSDNSAGTAVGWHIHPRGSGMEFIIDEWMLKHLRSTSNPLNFTISVTEGSYLYNRELRWKSSGSIDLTGLVPTTSGLYRWVIIGINPETDSFISVSGSTFTLSASVADPDNLELISFVQQGYIPLSAVWLLNGDTGIPPFRVQDLRHHLGNFFWYLEDLINVSSDSDYNDYVLTYKNGVWIGQPPQGGSSINEAHDIGYVPADGTDWTPDPDNIGDGLDQLADRVTDLEANVLAVSDGVTVVDPTDSVTFDGDYFDVINGGGGDALVTAIDVPDHSAARVTSGTLVHERGGLEADVSAFAGLVKISGGATSQAVDGTDYLLNLGSLTEEKALDPLVDSFPLRDNSASANRRIEVIDLLLPYLAEGNLITNGGFRFWQYGTTFAACTDGTTTADFWRWIQAGTGVVTVQRSTNVPTLAEHVPQPEFSIEIDITTADASIASSDLYVVAQRIEGYDMRSLVGRRVAISFWVMSPKTGTHCLSLRNSTGDRSYVAEYTVSSANTWEYKTVIVQVDMPTAGTWNYTTGIGLEVGFVLSAGSNFHGTVDTWNAASRYATSNQVNCMDNTANFFRLYGVDVRPGQIATPFFPRPFQIEQGRCFRRRQKSYNETTAPGTASAPAYRGCLAISNNLAIPFQLLSVPMRDTPTVVIYSRNGTINKVSDIAASDVGNTIGFGSGGERGGGLITDSGTALSSGTVYLFHFTASSEL